jgi:hypothetical protein
VAFSVSSVHFFDILLCSGHLDVIFSLLCICSQLTREVFLWYLRAISTVSVWIQLRVPVCHVR